jgi:TPR repeat protein
MLKRLIQCGLMLASISLVQTGPAPAQTLPAVMAQCESGDLTACLRGTALAEEHLDGEARTAFVKQGCKHGGARSCAHLGYLHFQGPVGVKQNFARALKLGRASCKAGDPEGCMLLGFIYAGGHGVKPNIFKSQRFFRKACDGGLRPKLRAVC